MFVASRRNLSKSRHQRGELDERGVAQRKMKRSEIRGIVCLEPSREGHGLGYIDSEGWKEILRSIVRGAEFL